jgi:ATP-dependent exoDNAse (exonuclease V) beta subunit
MLTIYRASAGAGKTHRLTGEYLLLLFKSQGAFRKILAVTFTNKATDEMKGRIIDELYNLSSGRKSDYVSTLQKEYKLSEDEIRSKASVILKDILHDYSSFNISTIDKFFQQTMRAFTREIGLQGGFGIEMETGLVLTKAIDNMFQDLARPENKTLLNWLISFAESKMEDKGGWRVEKDIESLGKELFNESYKQYSEQIAKDVEDKKTLEHYKETLVKLTKTTEDNLKKLASRAKKILEDNWLSPKEIKGGANSPLHRLDKWIDGDMEPPTNTFKGLADNLDAYFTKTMDNATKVRIQGAYEAGLNECVVRIVKLFDDMTYYYTAKEIIRFYYALGILSDIADKIAEYRTENNIMLISDTTELLHKVIEGSSTPFLYEKIGTRVENYMIDEFQDTSAMQWENFLPLIEESLSNGKDNLIVGDVKQSIYRFRNSDWRLLDEGVRNDFDESSFHEETLKDNWRSCKNIVDFNNALFTVMPLVLQNLYNEGLEESSLTKEEQEAFATRILAAYDRSYQNVPLKLRDKAGHVKVSFIESNEEKDWTEEALDRLPTVIEQLQDNNYKLKDIAILVRKNREGAMVAEKLLSYADEHKGNGYKYDIISDEALFVSNATSIRFLVALLRHVSNPSDAALRSIVLYTYQTLTNKFGNETPSFTDEQEKTINRLIRQPLYETVEGFVRLFSEKFPENEQVFLQAFMDLVSEFTKKESADIGRFLSWWNESGKNKTIATPDGQDAIRILTVHKSKGLGFRAVIMPFGDWEMDHSNKAGKLNILWCKPNVPPFDNLKVVPIKYSSALAETIFAKDYFKEKLYAYIDNLNTFYVALTRAKEEMIIFSPKPKKPKKTGEAIKINSIASALWSALQTYVPDTRQGEKLISLPESLDEENGVFELGEWFETSYSESDGKTSDELPMSHFVSISPDDRLQLRLHGRDLTFSDKKRKYGVLMHDVLSDIITKSDINIAVEQYASTGIMDEEEAAKMKTHLEELLSKDEVQEWFDPSAKVLNETDILIGDGNTKRPDRVIIKSGKVIVIDYKFGEKESKSYLSQVKKYVNLIKEMGYKDVTGYIWYVELDKIVQA